MFKAIFDCFQAIKHGYFALSTSSSPPEVMKYTNFVPNQCKSLKFTPLQHPPHLLVRILVIWRVFNIRNNTKLQMVHLQVPNFHPKLVWFVFHVHFDGTETAKVRNYRFIYGPFFSWFTHSSCQPVQSINERANSVQLIFCFLQRGLLGLFYMSSGRTALQLKKCFIWRHRLQLMPLILMKLKAG